MGQQLFAAETRFLSQQLPHSRARTYSVSSSSSSFSLSPHSSSVSYLSSSYCSASSSFSKMAAAAAVVGCSGAGCVLCRGNVSDAVNNDDEKPIQKPGKMNKRLPMASSTPTT